MKKIVISILSIFVLSFILSHAFVEAKTRSGGGTGTSSRAAKPASSTTRTSPSKSGSSSTTNSTTKSGSSSTTNSTTKPSSNSTTTKTPPSYSSLTAKYPKSTRYFSGNVLSQTLLFGTALLILNDTNADEPTYEDEEGNVYSLADLEDMDVQIPEEEPAADAYSETVTFNENEEAVPEVIETASPYELDENEFSYEEEENQSFNWLWLLPLLPVAVFVIIFLRRAKKTRL